MQKENSRKKKFQVPECFRCVDSANWEGKLVTGERVRVNECTGKRCLFCPINSLHLFVELRLNIQDLY